MKGSRQYRYLRCPHCGQSDGNDEVVTSSNIVEKIQQRRHTYRRRKKTV